MGLRLCPTCGEYLPQHEARHCRTCHDLLRRYNYRVAHIFNSTSLEEMHEHEDTLMEMRYRFRKEKLPDDFDYQLERVQRYISRKEA